MFAPPPEPPLWAWLLLGAVEFAIRVVALAIPVIALGVSIWTGTFAPVGR